MVEVRPGHSQVWATLPDTGLGTTPILIREALGRCTQLGVELDKMNPIRTAVLQVSDRCPQCGRRTLVDDAHTGELTCHNCGFVVSEHTVDQGPEWRSYGDDKETDRSRAGSPTSITRRDMGLSTMIGRSNRDASGRSFASPMRRLDREAEEVGQQGPCLRFRREEPQRRIARA